MHLEFLIEDISGEQLVRDLVDSWLSPEMATRKYHSFKGIGGSVPKKVGGTAQEIANKTLLDNLGRLLAGYGNCFEPGKATYPYAVVVVCDLDRRDKRQFEKDFSDLCTHCPHPPNAFLRLAIEEMEAWLLGDVTAILSAYPKCKRQMISRYKQDSICGTWELLADAIFPGGRKRLQNMAYGEIGKIKCEWAREIAPHMVPSRNKSPSFQAFYKLVVSFGISSAPIAN